tara:strand:- start:5305 stop:5883 length:579 start_codon:yes stop_codon:yes gene_type:complete
MPWEKSFDESDVIDKVMDVFWEKGYAATSISDITDATGIKRGSLYNAFDGKHDLFLKALQKYGSGERSKQLRLLETIENPRKAIAMLFDLIVKDTLNDPAKKGCLLVNTALDYSLHDESVQRVVTEGFKEVVVFIEKQIVRGQDQGDICESVKPRATARALVASLVGIRVLGRGTFDKAALRQIGDQAQRLI